MRPSKSWTIASQCSFAEEPEVADSLMSEASFMASTICDLVVASEAFLFSFASSGSVVSHFRHPFVSMNAMN